MHMENSADNDTDKKQRERQMPQKGVASVKKLVFSGIFLLLVGTTAANVYLLMHRDEEKTSQDGNAYIDPDASDWDDGIDTTNKTGGSIVIPGYSGAQMNAGETELKLRIGNPEENSCYLQATLKLEDGTVLYESGLIGPGKGFEKITLNQTLAAGTYEAMVHYQGVSMDENQRALNSSDSAFTLTVLP